MARKGWDDLSPAYRDRLSKAGISESAYNQGESIQSARGHSQTPEHPRSFNESRFRGYANEREALTRDLERRKAELFGSAAKDPKHGVRWNPERSSKNIRDKPPPLAKLRWALRADPEELLDAIREDPETFSFLGYH
jgi:hypothetical protein